MYLVIFLNRRLFTFREECYKALSLCLTDTWDTCLLSSGKHLTAQRNKEQKSKMDEQRNNTFSMVSIWASFIGASGLPYWFLTEWARSISIVLRWCSSAPPPSFPRRCHFVCVLCCCFIFVLSFAIWISSCQKYTLIRFTLSLESSDWHHTMSQNGPQWIPEFHTILSTEGEADVRAQQSFSSLIFTSMDQNKALQW